jgi:hypothetical protein
VLLAVSLAAGSSSAQEKVHNTLSTDQVEQLLRGMSLEFKKLDPKSGDGKLFYDFSLVKSRFHTRLYYIQGKEIMLDVAFPDQPLEKLNRWNSTRAKFTRAASHKEAKTPFTALEANLNFAGGVTENGVRRFIADFEQEVTAFDLFLAGGSLAPTPGQIGPEGDAIFTLANDKLDEIIKKMNLNPKTQPFNGGVYYDYESAKNYKIRLTNVKNQELMLDAVFKKTSLDTINKYNFNRKFIRAVLYTQGNVEYTALEAKLDCSAGVSENMVRHYVVTFEEEVQTFIEFLKKN